MSTTTPLHRSVFGALSIAAALLCSHAAGAEEENGWTLLRLAQIDEEGEGDAWRAVKIFPEPLRAAAQDFEITGFIVPILAEPELTHFLLVEQPEDCPFCGSAGYAPTLEVTMARALPDLPEFTQITLRGTLEFIEDPQTFQLYRLVDARPLDGGI